MAIENSSSKPMAPYLPYAFMPLVRSSTVIVLAPRPLPVNWGARGSPFLAIG
jgi:hypothetical protein